MSSMRAGTMAELERPSGDWAFIDIGFSSRQRTCGFLNVPAGEREASDISACAMTYGSLTREVVSLVRTPGDPLHLVVEAPLSAAFGANGNPVGRVGEKRGPATRYWYVGLGCSVLVAGLYLLKAALDARPAREVRLFEGLVSFKDHKVPSNHVADVEALYAAVWSGGDTGSRFYEARAIDPRREGVVQSTLGLLGADLRPPPIIEVTVA